MGSSHSNEADVVRPDVRQGRRETPAVPRIQRVTTPDDVVPRLVALGVPLDRADELARGYDEQRICDALDALEELDTKRRVLDPVGWVDAAIKQRWDVSGLLVERRQRERRLDVQDGDRQHRAEALEAYPEWRAVADRWDAAISAALDDEQLGRALAALTGPVVGVGRRSVPVARAELIAWAVDVHDCDPGASLGEALAEDLERGLTPAPARAWPLPEPPAVAAAETGDVASLSSRIGAVLRAQTGLAHEVQPAMEVAVPHRAARFGQDLER